MFLSDKVVNYTHRRQHPQYGKINNPDLDRGDFIFMPSKARQKEEEEEKKLQKKLEAKLKDLEVKRVNVEDKLLKVVTERKVLEEELERVNAEKQKVASTIRELEDKQIKKAATTIRERQDTQAKEKRLAYIPKEAKEAKIPKVKLRSVPDEDFLDLEKIVYKHNFFIKLLNERGDFPNDFVDNGDGTVTDRVTGLMWQKGGSSSVLYYSDAQEYVSSLNKERFSGYNDWRIPTSEELCSLVERDVNERGQHIDNLFHGKQKICWSLDGYTKLEGDANVLAYIYKYIVDFSTARVDSLVAERESDVVVNKYFLRAVRTIK